MTGIGEGERSQLLALLRAISPAALDLRPPKLGGRYRRLLSAPLPRVPEALLFDVYGTLLVSAAGGDPLSGLGAASGLGGRSAALLEEELVAAGIFGGALHFAREVGALIAAANGRRRPTCPFPEVDVLLLLQERFPAVSLSALRRLAILLEGALNPCAPMPGARGLLHSLARDRRPAGLVSNAQFHTELLLEAQLGADAADAAGADAASDAGARGAAANARGAASDAGDAAGDAASRDAGGEWPFLPQLCWFSYQLGVAKPDREAFDRAAAVLAGMGIDSSAAVYLGNSFDNDVVPARAAGFMTVLFAGDDRSYRPGSGENPIEPDSVVDSLEGFAALAGIH